MDNIIEINKLCKSFGEIRAVQELSFRVKKGELFAFLGVNGAGKSTTINIMCGQLQKDSGSILIDGVDTDRDAQSVKQKIGVVFQSSVLDASLSVYDNLESRAALYGITGNAFKERLAKLSELLEFKDLQKRTLGKLSGGQRRRIDVARALLHEPKILILDEPTTGLDPQTRKTLWRVINDLRRKEDMTVFLTTHYMEEAADADYVVNAIDLFYTSFLCDLVVALDPDDATLDEYGLGDDDFRYIVDARDKKGDVVHTFFISAPITDAETEEVYYYTLASQAGVPLLIRIPEQALIPQNQFKDMESTVFNEESVLNWAATNTVGAGLSEGIKPDEQYSGVKSVTVKAPIGTWKDGKLQNDGGMFQDTYYTVYKHNATTNQDILMITSQNGSYKDERWTTGKEFNKFYYMLIAHPIPSRFNSMTEAEIAEKATDKNLLFTLYVELNNGKVQLLEYYQFSPEYVMMRNTMGETVDGAIVMGETKTVFDTTRGQVIDYLQDSLIKLVTGVKIET